jgi:flavin reductase (DIM6/NTAB) family NADH-FMN oxidoreductase RutF
MSSNGVRDLPAMSATLYRRTCAMFATGITVITTVDENGHPHGMTVNSFSSVSLYPPLVLICVDLKNALLGHFMTSAWFAVNVLREGQEDVSRRFSSSTERRFEGLEFERGQAGVPLLNGVLARMQCSLTSSFEVGDHAVLVGEVRAAWHGEGQPLVYFNSGYRKIVG